MDTVEFRGGPYGGVVQLFVAPPPMRYEFGSAVYMLHALVDLELSARLRRRVGRAVYVHYPQHSN